MRLVCHGILHKMSLSHEWLHQALGLGLMRPNGKWVSHDLSIVDGICSWLVRRRDSQPLKCGTEQEIQALRARRPFPQPGSWHPMSSGFLQCRGSSLSEVLLMVVEMVVGSLPFG